MKRVLAYCAAAALLATPWVLDDKDSAASSLALCREAPGGFAPVAFQQSTAQSTGIVVRAATERHLACGGGSGGGGGGVGGCKIGQGSCGPR